MMIVERIETSDGVLHIDERAARRYCDEKMGEILTKQGHQLVHCDGYSFIVMHLENNLAELARAARWQEEAREKLSKESDET